MSFRARMIGAVLTVERGSAGGTVVTCAARRLRLDAAALLRNGDTHEQQS